MGFEKGVKALVAAIGCPACADDRHGDCHYLEDVDNSGPCWSLEDLAGCLPTSYCACYKLNPESHEASRYQEDDEEGSSTDMSKNESVKEMPVWEVTYVPYPSETKRVGGFERMVDEIASALYSHPTLGTYYGDIGLSAEGDAMTFSASEKTASRFGHKIAKFQDELGAFLGYQGYQGNLAARRVVKLIEQTPMDDLDELGRA